MDAMNQDAASGGDAAQAFEDLCAEVTVLRRAVDGLHGRIEQLRAPDYAPSLAAIVQEVQKVGERLGKIEKHPALAMTPQHHLALLQRAAEELLRDVMHKLDQAAQSVREERNWMRDWIGSARQQDEQLSWVLFTGTACLLFGLVMSPLLISLLPWGGDTAMAAWIVDGSMNRWRAGEALMSAGDPQSWNNLVASEQLVSANDKAVAQCRVAAAKEKKAQRCVLVVPAP
jgi:hypothetical protein